MSQSVFNSTGNGELLDGKYRIDRLLGEGGMGAVYRATHLGTKRTVAVKVIHPHYSRNEEFVERFRREAEAAGRLRHPNVVDVTDFGFAQTDGGRVAYLVMEYLDGCTLAEVLAEEQRLPVAWVVDILEQVCSAVDEAHRLGIVHRDLKPDNIWLEPNRRGGYTIKVLDFGLVKFGATKLADIDASPNARRQTNAGLRPDNAQSANAQSGDSSTLVHPEASTLIQPARPPAEDEGKDIASSEETATLVRHSAESMATRMQEAEADSARTPSEGDLTRIGAIMGTPLYMSPEQWSGEGIDARSDIYSIGVIAYRLLAGELPFTGTLDELARLHRRGDAPPIRKKNPKVPKRMERLIMSALAKDPAARPASAAGLASALRTSAEGSGALLRQAISLYSEHFPVFLRVSLLAYFPLMATIAVLNLSDPAMPWSFSPLVSMIVFGPLIFICMIVVNLLAYFSVSAVTAPIVMQLMVAPQRQPQIGTAMAAVKRRWWTLLATSIIVDVMILLGAAVFILPGVVIAICFSLYAPVGIMERLGVSATLKRAFGLIKRSWGTASVIMLLQFTLPVLVWIASVDSTFSLKLDDNYAPKEFSFYFNISGTSSLYQLLSIFVAPLGAIMTTLLYLKARRAGGESLKDVVEQFEALELPTSRWQARMRSRGASLSGTEEGTRNTRNQRNSRNQE